jgi:hypothetical protein
MWSTLMTHTRPSMVGWRDAPPPPLSFFKEIILDLVWRSSKIFHQSFYFSTT